jgi:hypothetical protein
VIVGGLDTVGLAVNILQPGTSSNVSPAAALVEIDRYGLFDTMRVRCRAGDPDNSSTEPNPTHTHPATIPLL